MTDGMREVEYVDHVGRHWVTMIPASQPDEAAPMGIPIGPISLEPLGLPLDWEVRLHNALVARRLLSQYDLQTRVPDVIAALRSVMKIGAHEIIDLYNRDPDL